MHGLVTGEDPMHRRGDLEVKLENPLGFFESECLVELNESLLQELGCEWDRPPLLPASWDQPPLLQVLQSFRNKVDAYAFDTAWVDKDPRLCITYPAYFHILLRRIPLVVALRDPLVVAISLHARNGFSLNRGLVLWWIYNHHIASQLSATDLLVTYDSLLSLNLQALQQFLGPFLEIHKHRRPSDNHAQALISSLLKPEFNRSETPLHAQSRARINSLLLKSCEYAYNNVLHAGDQITSFQEQFSSLPRPVLECSARDQLLGESRVSLLQNRLESIEFELRNVSSSLDQRERDCALLQNQLSDLHNSRSWKITSPLRAFSSFFRRSDT